MSSLDSITKILFTIIKIIISIIIGFVIFSPSSVIQKYDNVEIDYTVWESDENENYNVLNPVLDTVLWVPMIPITENSSTGIILGLYNNLLGRPRFFDSGLIWLNRCVDQDRNGIDDNTREPALTYGHSADLYFDTCLMIQFHVLNIQKSVPSNQLTDTELVFIMIIGVIITVIGGGLVFTVAGYYINKYWKYRKFKPKVVKERYYTRNQLFLKYGILLSLLTVITFIILGIVNLYSPLDVILQFNPGAFWIVIILIMVVWSFTIPLYLVIYRILKRN